MGRTEADRRDKVSRCADGNGGWTPLLFRGLRAFSAITLSLVGLGTEAEAAEAEEITALKPLALETSVVVKGEARAVIVAPEDDVYGRLARSIQGRVRSSTGVTLPIVRDTEVAASDWERRSTITLGNLMDNRFVETLYRLNYVHADVRYPGRGGFVVRTVHDPWGTGTNVIFLGGSDAEGVAAAVEHFLGLIPPSGDIVLDRLLTVRPGEGLEKESFAGAPDADAFPDRLKRDSNRSLMRKAAEFGLNYYMGGHADWALGFRDALFEHRSRPYMGWDDTHMELWFTLIAFDLVEESPALSDADRLALTHYLLEILRGPEGVFQQTFQGALKREPSVRHNHAMLPALDAYFGGLYFKKYYGLKETDAWLRDAAKIFESQAQASKTECDATAYESTAALPLPAIYALAEPDNAFLSSGNAAKAMDRIIGCMDNRFELSGNGDVYPAFPMPLLLMTNWFYRDGRYQWVMDRRREAHREGRFGKSMRYHIDGYVQPVKPVDMVGTRLFPVDPEFYRHWKGPEEIPPERRFDKISFRADFDPDRQYLLLDGLTIGSHGHDDVNAIIRFTDHDRVFLVDDSYSEGPNLKDHNAVTVIRNGLREDVPKAAEVLNVADLPGVGFSRTVARNHSGTDWTRSVIWTRDAHFVVIDELVAKEEGEYKMECLWRTLGEGAREGSVFRTHQAPSGSGEVREDSTAGGGSLVVFKGGMLSATADLPEGDYEGYAIGWGPDGGSNSVWVDLDGKRLPAFHLPEGELGPGVDPAGEASLIPFRIDRGGRHRFTLSLRENPPVYLDRLVFRSLESGEERALEAEAFRDSVEGRCDDFFLEGAGADRVEATEAGPEFLRFWSSYGHARPTINIVHQIATRRMEPGDRHRFVNLFYASNEGQPRAFRLRPVDETCALVDGDSRALVGSGAFNGRDLGLEADLFHLSEAHFSLTGASRLHAGALLFESREPVSIAFDLTDGSGTVIADRPVAVGLPPGNAVTVDGRNGSASEKGGLLWVKIDAGRHEVSVEGIPDALRQTYRNTFDAIAASARDIADGRPSAPASGAGRLTLLWSRVGEAPLTSLSAVTGAVYAGTQGGQVHAFSETGEPLWRHDIGAPITALHTARLKGEDVLFAGTKASHVCRLGAGGEERWTIQIPPLHPSMRYRAPGGESDIGGILAVEEGDAIHIFVGVANGWLRGFDGNGEQQWEFFGNARAFDQLAVGDLDGSGERVAVVTGQPSHFGSCLSFDMAGEQKGHNGMDGWARVTTQMRVADLDGDGRDEAFCGTGLGNLYLLKGSRLRTAWTAMLGDEITDLSTVGPAGDRRIVVASRSFYVYSVAMDGAVQWASNLNAPVTHACGIDRRGRFEIAAAYEGGNIAVLSAEDGKVLARYPTDAQIVALSAADLNGDGEDEIVAGLENGTVIALRR